MLGVSARIRRAAALSLLLSSIACGSSIFIQSPADPSLLDPSQPRSPTPDVTISSTGLTPVVLHVNAPVTVTFTNTDTVTRRFQNAPELGWDNCPEMNGIGSFQPGEKKSIAFSEHDAVCTFEDADQPKNVAFQGYVAIHPD